MIGQRQPKSGAIKIYRCTGTEEGQCVLSRGEHERLFAPKKTACCEGCDFVKLRLASEPDVMNPVPAMARPRVDPVYGPPRPRRPEPPKVTIPEKEPVGSKLKEILAECGIAMRAGCVCERWRVAMNQWGTEGCAAHRTEILKYLSDAAKESSWLKWINVAARGYLSTSSLLDEAIHRATPTAPAQAI